MLPENKGHLQLEITSQHRKTDRQTQRHTDYFYGGYQIRIK